MAILEVDGLTRRFGDRTVVDSLTFTVDSGESVGLLGPNGAGKSTTLKMLVTLLPPSAGTARLAGFDVVRQPAAVRRVIGYVPQLVSADGALTGYENLLVFAKLYDVPRAHRAARIGEVLDFMGLAADAGRLVREYSGGMIRRLEIAQAVMHRPPVLFLDEPTVGLDPVGRAAVWDRLARLRAEAGTTLVFTTHLMDEADIHAGRVVLLHRGRLAALGRPTDLKAALGPGEHTLDDVFLHYAGQPADTGAGYRDTASERRTSRRLG